MPLTAKQQRFVDEYQTDLNATQAAIRAGYSVKTARTIASELMAKPEIADAIAEARQGQSERTQITADNVLKEIALIGFARMNTYISKTATGDAFIDLSLMTDEQSAALSELTVEDYTDGRGEGARDVKRTKIKLHPKLDALDKLSRHLGLYAAKKHEHTGKDGAPIETRDMTDDDVARRLAALVAKIEAETQP